MQLSEGLYSKDTHFILELIQNAEDNQYASGSLPGLVFRLMPDDPTKTPNADGALLVLNNEIGFQQNDVDALCSIGGSTKSKREGYIGEKGIGFKSVFLVSSQPYLLSNGYQFYFREQPDEAAGIGYIVPYWANTPKAVLEKASHTAIILPLKANKYGEVAAQLKQIAPETMLFLQKLQDITVEIAGQETMVVRRRESLQPLVSLQRDDQTSTFWLIHSDVTVPSVIEEPKREKATLTRRLLTFSRLGSSISEGTVTSECINQNVLV